MVTAIIILVHPAARGVGTPCDYKLLFIESMYMFNH